MLATFVEVLSLPLLAGAAVAYLNRVRRARQVPLVSVIRADGKVVELPADDERIRRHL